MSWPSRMPLMTLGGSADGLVAVRMVAAVRASVPQKIVAEAPYSTRVLLVDFCLAF